MTTDTRPTRSRLNHSRAAESADSIRPKVLHAMAVSVPHLTGYTMRGRYIVNTQRETGHVEPVVVTSCFYPGVDGSSCDGDIEGVRYIRVPHPADRDTARLTFGDRILRMLVAIRAIAGGSAEPRKMATVMPWFLILFAAFWAKAARLAWSVIQWLPSGLVNRLRYRLRQLWRVSKNVTRHLLRPTAKRLAPFEQWLLTSRFQRGIERAILAESPDLIHAHSPHWCGRAAAAAAKKHGLPVVYEVRGLWEDTAVAEGRWTPSDRAYRQWRDRETQAFQSADAVICICQQLEDEVASRGISRDRIFSSPNAVDPHMLESVVRAEEDVPVEVTELRISAPPITIGYIGSIRKLEGVDELVRGFAMLVERGHNVRLLIVGDGKDQPGLVELAETLGVADQAVFTGRVAHENIRFYYDMIDLFVVSRPAVRVAEKVTPLKPLEAMAMQTTLVVSSVAALRELVHDGQTGLVYPPGQPDELADALERLIDDPIQRKHLALAAHNWVKTERTWKHTLNDTYVAYETLLNRRVRTREPDKTESWRAA